MKLGDGVEWALHCCVLLAALPPDDALPATRLAEYHGVPSAYLAKHLQALARAGIVESTPGRRGGYRLARPADKITFLDVVEAVEGDEPAFRCTEIRQRGPIPASPAAFRSPCAIAVTMARAEHAWRKELGATTIADIGAALARKLDRGSIQAAGVWLAEARS
jgi:Rrf2 family protein